MAIGVVVVLVVAAIVAGIVVLRPWSDDDGGGDADAVAESCTPTASPPASSPTPVDGGALGLWSVPLESDAEGAVTASTDHVYVVQGDTLEVFAAADGRRLWSTPIDGDAAAPVVPLGPCVLIADSQGVGPTTTLQRSETAEVLWSMPGLPIATDVTDVVLLDRGTLVAAVDRETGTNRWARRDLDDVQVCSDVVIGRGPEGTVALSVDDGAELWSAPGRPGPCRDGEVAVVADGAIVVHAVADGSEASRLPVDEPAGRAWVIGDQVVFETDPGDALGMVAILDRGDGTSTWEADGFVVRLPGEDLVQVRGQLDEWVVRAETAEVSMALGWDEDHCGIVATTAIVAGCGLSELSGWRLDVGERIEDPIWTVAAAGPIDSFTLVGDRLYVVSPGTLDAYG